MHTHLTTPPHRQQQQLYSTQCLAPRSHTARAGPWPPSSPLALAAGGSPQQRTKKTPPKKVRRLLLCCALPGTQYVLQSSTVVRRSKPLLRYIHTRTRKPAYTRQQHREAHQQPVVVSPTCIGHDLRVASAAPAEASQQ